LQEIPGFVKPSFSNFHNKQTSPGKQLPQLIRSNFQTIFTGIYQQNQIKAGFKPVPDKPVRFPADPPGPVPFYRNSELPGEGKGYTVVREPVFQPEQFRSVTAKAFSLLKNRLDFIFSL
jgi:hypothetical protein